ncbi:MAG TPA: CBS domain-containing protein [Candidatus Polarisedimenticolaceae bacterium]|nr:CBS domain-containing protein [Candidatus Polarisedimenticolaceae bacterium]
MSRTHAMVHLSEVLGIPVHDAEGVRLGKLDDLRVDSQRGIVDRIVIRGGGAVRTAAWSAVETFSPEHRRVALVETAAAQSWPGPEADTLCLKRDVLDRQIIDTQGRKVVKVNDIELEPSGQSLVLRRVEVGLAGLVRRLLSGLVSPRLLRRLADGLSQQGIPWDYVAMVEPGTSRIRLKVHQQIATMHPADLADILEDLNRVERKRVMAALDPETAAQALSEAEPSVQAAVVEAMHVEQAADVLEEMAPDEAADILGDLPEERLQAVLDAMEEEEADEVRGLLVFKEDSAGGLMTSDFFQAKAGWTVGETLAMLQKVDDDIIPEMDEIPLSDDAGKLVGIVPLVRLVRAPGGRPVTEFMRRETRAVTTAAPFKDVVERFEKYHLRALAVVDEFNDLKGIINIEDVLSRLVKGD